MTSRQDDSPSPENPGADGDEIPRTPAAADGPRPPAQRPRVQVDLNLAVAAIAGGQSTNATAAMLGVSRRTLGRRFDEGLHALQPDHAAAPGNVHLAAGAGQVRRMPPPIDGVEPGEPPPWWLAEEGEPDPLECEVVVGDDDGPDGDEAA